MTSTLTLDALAAVKEKQQATWASGDYAVIGTSLQIIGEELCEAVDVSAGQKVLDVPGQKDAFADVIAFYANTHLFVGGRHGRTIEVWESPEQRQRFVTERLEPLIAAGPEDPTRTEPPDRAYGYALHYSSQ